MKTVNDLIKRLVDIRDEQGLGDAEIRIATEPSRPVPSALLGVATTLEIHFETAENPEEVPDDLPCTVWLCAGDRCREPDTPSEAYQIASYVS